VCITGKFSTLSSNLCYTGEYTDPSGLVYLRARYMNPSLGVFLSKDPFAGWTQRVMSRNGYTYAEGNPVNFTDPSGEFINIPGAILGGIGGGITGYFLGRAFAGRLYELAKNCKCGKDLKNWADATNKSQFVNQTAREAAKWGAISGALAGSGPIGMAIDSVMGIGGGALGLADSVPTLIKDLLKGKTANLCKVLEALGSVAAIAGGTLGLKRSAGPALNQLRQIPSALRNAPRTLRNLGASVRQGLQELMEGCFNSFSADTTVATEDGDIAISDIEIGDDVLAYNEETGETDSYEVTDTISHVDPEIVLLTIDGETLETTSEHPFYTISGEWVEAADLRPGDLIRNIDGSYGEVNGMRIVEREQAMFNLTVDEAHTFFVGDGQWLVHNCNPTIENARVIDNPPGVVDPNTIRFTQDSIGKNFKNGNSLQNTVEGLQTGTISPEFEPIRVFQVGDQIFTLDNRRLYVFQQAGLPINTASATAQEIANESWKFTTRNFGASIRVRGG